MKKITLSVLILIALSFFLLMCAQESGPVDSNTTVIDPITNQWISEADSDHTFSFITYDSLVTRGVFWGDEDHPTEGSNDLCGFFDGVYVEFDVRRPFDGRTKFKGKFINSNRMEIESSEEVLSLTR
jgi:hypothetical protein